MEKIDARKLTAEGREVLRRMVIRLRKQSGMPVKELARVAGVHFRTVEDWLARARREGAGSLGEKARGRPVGACRKLKMADEDLVAGADHRANADAIEVTLCAVDPAGDQSADPGEIRGGDAGQIGGEIPETLGIHAPASRQPCLGARPGQGRCLVETDLPQSHGAGQSARCDHSLGRRNGREGRRQLGARLCATRPDARLEDTSALAETLDDFGHFRTRRNSLQDRGRLDQHRALHRFLEALIQDVANKIFLVVDNLRVHHARKVKDWLCGKETQIELVFLPPYAPESNPDEYLNRDFKTALRTGPVSHNTDELLEKAMSFMKRIASLPGHVMAYFRHPAAAYRVFKGRINNQMASCQFGPITELGGNCLSSKWDKQLSPHRSGYILMNFAAATDDCCRAIREKNRTNVYMCDRPG